MTYLPKDGTLEHDIEMEDLARVGEDNATMLWIDVYNWEPNEIEAIAKVLGFIHWYGNFLQTQVDLIRHQHGGLTKYLHRYENEV